MSAQGKSSVFPARLIAGILLFVFAFIGPTGCYETRRGRERAIARGKMLFELHCCGCHNGRRSDLVKIPPNLAGIFRSPILPSGAPATDAMVRSTILVGRSGIMPPFEGSLSDEQIENIIRYLHSVGPETRLCTTN
jgi:mono/diheme cytochrome c family protein